MRDKPDLSVCRSPLTRTHPSEITLKLVFRPGSFGKNGGGAKTAVEEEDAARISG